MQKVYIDRQIKHIFFKIGYIFGLKMVIFLVKNGYIFGLKMVIFLVKMVIFLVNK